MPFKSSIKGLDYYEVGAGGTPADTVVSETSYGQSPSAGVATTFSRGDHTHGTPTGGGGIAKESHISLVLSATAVSF
jgi:hypothetical protein